METSTRATQPTTKAPTSPSAETGSTTATVAAIRSAVSLDDKYTLDKGRVYMTGTQALVRLLMAQKKRDEAAGLNTAGFVSGYRGSPLGAVDQELWRARKHLDAHQIQFVPGLNEELAATSVWGTQMVNLDPNATVDGVFAMWYGKGPGVDRSGDVFKHANVAGTSKHGGVLVIAGDDHTCKSSTLPHQSEHAFIAAMIPVLNPSGVREFIEFGLHGYAMSRYSGCWIGFKSISDTIESSSSFEIDPMALEIKIPDSYPIPEGGFHMRWPDLPLEQESRLQRHRLYALLEYVRQNNINRQDWQAPDARLGIVTCGKSYLDVREALDMLGIDENNASALGLRLLKIGMSWPLEPEIIREFAQGLDEILVIEEKRQIIEYQIKEQLYHAPADSRPRVVGKFDETGEWVHEPQAGILLSPNGEITPTQIAHVLAMRMARVQGADSLPTSVLNYMVLCRAGDGYAKADPSQPQRVPFFCSGCPHNTSTKVPEGSRATAGIGCHFMAQWMDRRTQTFTQMGGEGASWIGQANFTSTPHVFANLGDGTYMHSGSLAIRAAKASGVNITYKILVNDAVAMTGGQPVEGAPTVPQILQQVSAEGITHVHLVSDEPELFKSVAGIPAHVQVHERGHMDALQRQLREVKGVSVIVYAQTCAAEKRRRRKRKEMLDPPKRVVINEEVCEGCGDCGVQSNCVSIQPLETPLGRKRTIDQSSCNKDLSCVQGFCPSFVTVEGGQLRKRAKANAAPPENLPEPVLQQAEIWNIVVTGVGGTGVVTIGALLGMAAHLENKGVLVLDMAGLAQKGGAVMSHIRLATNPELLHAARVVPRHVDLLLGCDLMVAAGNEAIASLDKERSHAILNTEVAPTGAFTSNPDWQVSPEGMAERVRQAACEVQAIDASSLATALMGDAVATNVFLLGYAWQMGWIPLRGDSLIQAIELNGAAVAMNKAAFAWGRQAALNIDTVRDAAGLGDKHTQRIAMPQRLPTLKGIVEDRVERLTAYQNARYAQDYAGFVAEIAAIEKTKLNSERFSREVAISLYKLMAYKDEYEVARLFVDTGFMERIERQFEGDFQLRFHLAPPLLAKKDAQGRLLKSTYGPWMLKAYRALAKLKFLRGTAFDVFGKTDERRSERAAIGEFKALMQQVAQELQPHKLNTALELARLPQSIRGYGHVKERNGQASQHKQQRLLEELRYQAPLEQRMAS